MSFFLNKFYTYNKTLILMLCLLSLISISFWDDVSTKFLHAAGLLAFVSFLMNPNRYLAKNPAFIIFISLCLFGVVNVIWYSIFKEPGTLFANAYRGPMETGKIALFSAFIFLILISNDKNDLKKESKNWIYYSSLLTQIIFFIHAMWQHFYLHIGRVDLSTSHATTAGYIMMFPALLSSILIIKSNSRYKTILYMFGFLLSLCAIITTGTRGAILVFLFFSLLMVFLNSIFNKKIDYKFCFLFVFSITCGLFIFKDTLVKRVNDFNSDISRYSNDNSRTSVGARFAMYEVGLKTYAIMGQSLEDRAKKIHELENTEPRLSGALPYIDSHLHNDFIDTLSTRGIPGVLLIIFVYYSFAFYSIKKAKEPYILILLSSLIIIGLSDVILFSKPVPTAALITLSLLCVFLKLNDKNKNPNKSGQEIERIN